jgi:acetylornithine deacetylase/succinyl-diaminopimelate desuccinylase-like protein
MSVSTDTFPLPLDPTRQAMFDAIVEKMDPERMQSLLVDLVNIHSPTGGERAASEFMASHLSDVVGIDASYQPISDLTGNAHAEVLGTGEGARLLLYAPIDTHIDPDVDVPWVGRSLREDMVPVARVDGDLVFGLGASNPKCMVAGLTEIVHASVDAGVEFVGDLAVGFAGGGMPWCAGRRDSFGMSTGVYHLLNRGMYPDFCIVLKPRWAVYPEEPGMCWFKVSVYGDLGYAGITRGTPGFRSSIVPAATVIQEIEAWLPEYTRRNTSGFVLPEGWISAVRSGDPEKPAFPSATTEIFLDVRITPRTSPAEVRHQFGQLISAIRDRHPDFELEWEMYGSVPGGATDKDNWIIQSSQRGFEIETGEPYTQTPYQAGQTDGAMIRRLGVPTARVGYPWPPATSPPELLQGLGGMGVASISDVMKGMRTIAYAVVDTLTRTREELEL